MAFLGQSPTEVLEEIYAELNIIIRRVKATRGRYGAADMAALRRMPKRIQSVVAQLSEQRGFKL